MSDPRRAREIIEVGESPPRRRARLDDNGQPTELDAVDQALVDWSMQAVVQWMEEHEEDHDDEDESVMESPDLMSLPATPPLRPQYLDTSVPRTYPLTPSPLHLPSDPPRAVRPSYSDSRVRHHGQRRVLEFESDEDDSPFEGENLR